MAADVSGQLLPAAGGGGGADVLYLGQATGRHLGQAELGQPLRPVGCHVTRSRQVWCRLTSASRSTGQCRRRQSQTPGCAQGDKLNGQVPSRCPTSYVALIFGCHVSFKVASRRRRPVRAFILIHIASYCITQTVDSRLRQGVYRLLPVQTGLVETSRVWPSPVLNGHKAQRTTLVLPTGCGLRGSREAGMF